jgi:predicted nucleotidyltransferase
LARWRTASGSGSRLNDARLNPMYPHHEAALQRTIEHFQPQPDVRALLLGGSIAHGFAAATSDVDIMIVVADEDYVQRQAGRTTVFFSAELANYPDGYVDGKYISQTFLDQVEQRGSEPARFAFADAQVLFSHIDGLSDQLARIARYPAEQKQDRIQRFMAQLHAWHWYVGEAERKQNAYLMTTACAKLLLFGGRLAHNQQLYPYHKWLRAVLARVPDKPAQMLDLMETVSQQPSSANAGAWYELITGFREWESGTTFWPNHFMRDSELTWLAGLSPIDDL